MSQGAASAAGEAPGIASVAPRGDANPTTARGRGWRRYLALAMAGTVLAGVPLMLMLLQPWATALLAAVVVFPAVAIIALLLRLLRHTSVPEPVVILAAAAVIGAAAGLLIFSPVSYDWFGLVVCIPIALVVAGVGIGLDYVFAASARFTNATIAVGSVLLAVSIVGTIATY